MNRKMVSAALLLCASLAAAGDKDGTVQTGNAFGIDFKFTDSLDWQIVPDTSAVLMMSADEGIAVIINESPLRGCGNVMSRIGGNAKNTFADHWYKTVVFKPGKSISMCLDAKHTSFIATVTVSVEDLKDPLYQNLDNVMTALGKALKKK